MNDSVLENRGAFYPSKALGSGGPRDARAGTEVNHRSDGSRRALDHEQPLCSRDGLSGRKEDRRSETLVQLVPDFHPGHTERGEGIPRGEGRVAGPAKSVLEVPDDSDRDAAKFPLGAKGTDPLDPEFGLWNVEALYRPLRGAGSPSIVVLVSEVDPNRDQDGESAESYCEVRCSVVHGRGLYRTVVGPESPSQRFCPFELLNILGNKLELAKRSGHRVAALSPALLRCRDMTEAGRNSVEKLHGIGCRIDPPRRGTPFAHARREDLLALQSSGSDLARIGLWLEDTGSAPGRCGINLPALLALENDREVLHPTSDRVQSANGAPTLRAFFDLGHAERRGGRFY
jgi:hypothetical protein